MASKQKDAINMPCNPVPTHVLLSKMHSSYTKYKLTWSYILLVAETNKTHTHTHIYTPTHSGKHKNQPSGSKFHFISRFSKEQAGESIHAISSCAEGGLAAMETDVAPLQTAALIQSTGVNTQAHGDGGWALLLPWLENTIAK